MKSLYKCERCGRISEDYEEISLCESSHYVLERPYCYEDVGLNETLAEMTEYKEGQEEPNVIHVWFSRMVWDDEESKWKTERRCGKYKLISSYEMPLKVTDD